MWFTHLFPHDGLLKLSDHLLQGIQTEHMQWGPLVEIRGSVSPFMVVVLTNNNPFNCYCWAITLMNRSKDSKWFLQHIYFFHLQAHINGLGWCSTAVLWHWACHRPWKRGKVLMDQNKETADFKLNKSSVLGKLIFVRIYLKERLVGCLLATGLMGGELLMESWIKEDILSFRLNPNVKVFTRSSPSSICYANQRCAREWNEILFLSFLIKSKVKRN